MSFRLTGRVWLIVTSLAVLASAPAWGITVEPAGFDHFEIKLPEKVQAGEEFTIPFSLLDRYGNEMRIGWKPESPLTLSFSPPAALLTPSALTRENYTPGFSFKARSDSAGTLQIKLLDGSGRELGSWSVTVLPGRPASMQVQGPANAVAGEGTSMRLSYHDRFGNLLPGYEPEPADLTMEGASMGTGQPRKGSDGTFELPVTFGRTGQVTVLVRDRRAGLSAASEPVAVGAAPLYRFIVESEEKPVPAGEPVAVTLRAVDRQGNVLTDYSRGYRGVRISSEGVQVIPDLVPPADFVDGVARTRLSLKKAGRHVLTFQEVQGAEKGELGVQVVAGPVSRVEVRTPDKAVAGEPFEIVVSASDAFGNVLEALPTDSVIRLETTGTGTMLPDMVPASAYRQGEARVKVRYEVAESFTISASIAGGAAAAAPDRAREAADRAREEAQRAKRESRLRQQRVAEKIETPPEQAPRQAAQPKAVSPPAPPKPAPQAPSQQKAAPAPVPARPQTAPMKALRPGFLDGVSVEEKGDTARVSFSTNGLTDYNVSTSAKMSRKWIELFFPVLKPDMPERLKGGGDIVGEIYVEEPSTGGVTVSVEILPVRIGYDIAVEGGGLVLKVQRQ